MNADVTANRMSKNSSPSLDVYELIQAEQDLTRSRTTCPAYIMAGTACNAGRLFDRDRLGQVTRLVNIQALGVCKLHREDLQRNNSEDGLNRYLAEIKKFPILTAEEEYMLAKRYQEHADPEAAAQLVEGEVVLGRALAGDGGADPESRGEPAGRGGSGAGGLGASGGGRRTYHR